MDFNAAVDKFMRDVEDGSTRPRLLFRDNDGWHCDHTQNQYGDTYDWVEDAKATDPFAVTLTGEYFAKSGWANVYDRLLLERLRAEYATTVSDPPKAAELYALMNFLDENIGTLSFEATEHIVQYDNPLTSLHRMLPLSLVSNDSDDYYDTDKIDEAVELIEDIIEKLNKRPDLSHYEAPAKRMIESYEEKICIQFAGKEVVIAENSAAEQPYLLCNIKYDNPLGIEERYDGIISDDYVEIIREFAKRIDTLAVQIETDRRVSGLPIQVMTAKDCLPGSQDMNWEGKLLIIKPEALAPEYRDASNQLVIGTSGFGLTPGSRGSKVYIKELLTGKECYYRSHQIAGVADPSKLPQWAVDKQAEHTKPHEQAVSAAPVSDEKPLKKPSLLGKLDDNKQKVERDKAANKDKPATKNRGGKEVTD